jgi:cell division protein FtsB
VAGGCENLLAVSSRGKPRRAARARRRRQRLSARRLVLILSLVLITLLYAGPLRSYYGKRQLVDQERAQVTSLRTQNSVLKRKLARARTPEAEERRARRLSFVRQGEHLYIVKGIDSWLRAHPGSSR